jgi:hypothetical protein
MKTNAWFQLRVMGVVALAALVGVFIWKFPSSSSDWAAWVQAFGAIAAILAASAIASRQSSQAKREEADRRIAQLKGVRGLLDELNATLSLSAARIQEREGSEALLLARERLRPMAVALEAIRRIPFHEVPMVYLGATGLNYLNMYSGALQTLEAMASEVWEPDNQELQTRIARGISKLVRFSERANADLASIGETVEKYDGVRSPNITLSDIE